MTKVVKVLRRGAALCALTVLASCGGGGGGSNSSGGGSPSVSTAPSFTSGNAVSVIENTAENFYTATATDPQGDAVSFGIEGGADAGEFVITANGALRFNNAPNYDLPADANNDNVYEVTLRATAGGETVTRILRVTVTNDREGILVTRVATGFVDPVAIAFVHNQPQLLVAERGGRVLEFDPNTGAISENTYIRDNRSPGEIVTMAFGFPENSWQEGIYLLTHDPVDGLFLQAFNSSRGKIGKRKLDDPWITPIQASLVPQREMYLAIGSSQESDAQDASSVYGKLVQLGFYDPYAGASLPPSDELQFRYEVIGDGIQRPGGITAVADFLYLADQGSSIEHELTIFSRDWRPLDFGWPFYEGSKEVSSDPPAQVNGPTIAYQVGDLYKQGTGIVAGLQNDYNFFEELGDTYVFADTNGTIWSIPRSTLGDGFLHFSNDLEVRTEDFAPDQGQIDSPVGFSMGFGTDHFYILDADGEIFRVEGET